MAKEDIELSQNERRLLAALFLRSNMVNRRRRYPEGYTMDELDGCTLNQADIFLVRGNLERRGLLQSHVVSGRTLVMKLTEDGQRYCLEEIYPNLAPRTSNEDSIAQPETSDRPPEIPQDFQDMTIEQMWEAIKKQPDLLSQIAQSELSSEDVRESRRQPVRDAIGLLASIIEKMDFSNADRSQIICESQIIMIMLESPAADRREIGRHLLKILDKVAGHGIAAAGLVVAILAYLATK